ncbi:MAG: helix-turn-helix domain-containing protein [Acidobacteria bacterium]|nr:MAG: helix-turn-helix domain-containing protein [Acidobacteriota bacterium]
MRAATSGGAVAGEWLTSDEAARLLGVRRSTLYAYVSRELIESRPQHGTRRRLYSRRDLQRLRRRSRSARNPSQAARSALDWGAPVLDSELTAIDDGEIWVRGVSLLGLARERTLEEVAAHLWQAAAEAAEPGAPGAVRDASTSPTAAAAGCGTDLFDRSLDPLPPQWRRVLETLEEPHPGVLLQTVAALAAAEDLAAADRRVERMTRCAARVVQVLFRAASGITRPTSMPFDRVLQRAWAPGRRELRPAIRAALVLCADHELNVSSFVVRCVASAGSSPYDGAVAGISALRGSRHGGLSDRCEALLAEIAVPSPRQRVPAGEGAVRDQVRRALAARLQRGETVPGFFAHPLHPSGDPRFVALVEVLRSTSGIGPAFWRSIDALVEEGADLMGEPPTIDLGLAIVARALEARPGTAWTLFALGRSIGWMAHFLEEVRRDRLIRPRARYVGPPPSGPAGSVDLPDASSTRR